MSDPRRIVRIKDCDTGESELEFYKVPEGFCLTFAHPAIEDEYLSCIVSDDDAVRLAAHIFATADRNKVQPI